MRKKLCGRCREERPMSDFGKDNSKPDKFHNWCKACKNKAQQERRAKNRPETYVRRGEIVDGKKRCPKCEMWLPVTDFNKHGSGLACWCKVCQRFAKYGLTDDTYETMLTGQNNQCAICHRTFTGTPCIDHDHLTGAIRGLLCQVCNSGLGFFKDDPVVLANAIEYKAGPFPTFNTIKTVEVLAGMKYCSYCHLVKYKAEFYRDSSRRDKLRPHCKTCVNKINRECRAGIYIRRPPVEKVDGKKKCPRCETWLAVVDFDRSGSGFQSWCKVCAKLRHYGLTRNDREMMVTSQNNQCAICQYTFTKTPHVDHDHWTNGVRGLLCSGCNVGLGLFRDNPTILANAIKYLEATDA